MNSSIEIFNRLHRVAFGYRSLSFCAGWKYVPVRERRRLLREVDDLHRDGTPWPMLPFGPGGKRVPWTPRVEPDEQLTQTARPEQLPYCVFWTGAYWAPAFSVKRRREAGYLPLLMAWSGDPPSTGDFISTGDRARFAYRIAEVERFRAPRTRKALTCRFWCTRVHPADVPPRARVHQFFWHARGKRTA